MRIKLLINLFYKITPHNCIFLAIYYSYIKFQLGVIEVLSTDTNVSSMNHTGIAPIPSLQVLQMKSLSTKKFKFSGNEIRQTGFKQSNCNTITLLTLGSALEQFYVFYK
jgi:hypothetical protein